MDIPTDLERADDVAIACTLSEHEAGAQTLEWVDLQQQAVAVVAIAGGARMAFPASLADDVADLARREAGCCAFLTINTLVVDDVLFLDVSSTQPDAFPVISALAGIPVR